jgi:hypothetical protein
MRHRCNGHLERVEAEIFGLEVLDPLQPRGLRQPAAGGVGPAVIGADKPAKARAWILKQNSVPELANPKLPVCMKIVQVQMDSKIVHMYVHTYII